jgi:hypothetical protein
MNNEKFYNTFLKNVIRILTVTFVAASLSFFMWYLFGWFITSQSNAMSWTLWFKVPYIFFGVVTTIALIDLFLNAKECEN